MASKLKNSSIPGQLYINLNGEKELYKEEKIQICKPYQSRRYWEKLKEFLDKSGKFSQTWHLYLALRDTPEPKDFEDNPEKELAYNYHIYLMTDKHGCNNQDELFSKAAKEWDEYRDSFEALKKAAIEANVDPRITEGYKKTFMSAFAREDWDGPCRREFYRNKFVKKALLKFKKNPYGYVEPINIREMEKAFAENESYKVNFKKKREKAKARDRNNRAARMNPKNKGPS
ncbi:hypothetical protein IJF91_01425 [Candidatus Saccharibacteria bacterium]|nr:hypothetical protein [Candidatus Saccharibacteria bacterium]